MNLYEFLKYYNGYITIYNTTGCTLDDFGPMEILEDSVYWDSYRSLVDDYSYIPDDYKNFRIFSVNNNAIPCHVLVSRITNE